jgi:hypothetical protein
MAEVDRLFELLDSSPTTVTSIRQPAALPEAVKVATALGMAGHPDEAVVEALRQRIEAFAEHRALEAHVDRHPDVRPSLADLAVAAAELDGHPLAGAETFLRTCAAELAELRPDATAEDVVVYAMGRQAASRDGT